MATVVRVKRKLTEEPTEKIVISCKRPKGSDLDNEGGTLKEVFRLAGTVKSKNEADLRSALDKNKAANPQKSNTRSSQPGPPRQSKDKKAYSVIGQQHIDLLKTTTESNIQGASAVSNNVCLFDAVINDDQWPDPQFDTGKEDIVCNGEVMVKVETTPGNNRDSTSMETDEDGYVYDIFYLDREEGAISFELFENILCIEAFGEDYSQFADYRHDRIYEDDNDDSNDEDNWRNDYPDEEEGYSDEENRVYGAALDDVNDVLRFDRVRLASSEESEEDDLLRDYQFTENKSFERYYSSYKKSKRKERRGVGECNTSSEDNDDLSMSDGCDDL